MCHFCHLCYRDSSFHPPSRQLQERSILTNVPKRRYIAWKRRIIIFFQRKGISDLCIINDKILQMISLLRNIKYPLFNNFLFRIQIMCFCLVSCVIRVAVLHRNLTLLCVFFCFVFLPKKIYICSVSQK